MASTRDLLHIAEDAIDASHKLEEQQKDIYKETLSQLESINFGDDITKPILALLALDDKSFESIAPVFLLDINKSFHDSNNQLMMLQTFNANGLSLEDFYVEIDELINLVENEDLGLSQAKKDFVKQIFSDLYNSISEIKGIPKKVIQIPIEIINNEAKIPCYANPTDSGMDIYALEDITIHPGETKLIPIGLKVAIPVGYELQVRPKSGRTLKTKLRVANTPGTIDSGYRDEIGVIIDNIEAPIKDVIYDEETHNITGVLYGSSYTIGKGEKFAQLVLCEVSHCAFMQIDNINDISNDGRKGGFGSTGLK